MKVTFGEYIMAFFALDIETLGVESTSVILSVGAVYSDGEAPFTYKKFINESIFIKFDYRDQVDNYGRTTDRSTMDWWKQQSKEARDTNLAPSANDVSTITGIQRLREWFSSKPDAKKLNVWQRGTLDQTCLDSLFRAAGVDPLTNYGRWRDIRTALECYYPSAVNGYVEVDLELVKDFDPKKVITHHAAHDCARDLCMLVGGKL
jgi:hypothetical protein